MFDRVLQQVAEFVGRLLSALSGAPGGSTVGAIVVLVFVVVAALLLARFARTLRRDPAVGAVVTGGLGRSSTDWLEDAADHERAGRWRAALRCQYRALIADLAAADLVEEVPGRTTGEYLAAGRAAVPAAGPALATATIAFDVAWYGTVAGAEPVGRDEVAAFRARAAEVRAAAGLRPPVGAQR